MSEKAFTVVWWNTSLSPSAKSKASEDKKQLAAEVINLLTRDLAIDFIALCEISEDDINYIKSVCELSGYAIRSGVAESGRSTFDTCFIYKQDKVAIVELSNVVSMKGGSELRIAQRLDLVLASSSLVIHMFASHWPSRLWCAENHADRHYLGLRLRDAIDEIFSLYEEDPHIILLGDYNDEPFDKSISDQLMATRDISLVLKRKHLLYNPFWKSMGPASNDMRSCGTYFYKSGKTTQWHVFDQMMFSRAFITNGRKFNDGGTILSTESFMELIGEPKEKFDHLPIVAKLEMVA